MIDYYTIKHYITKTRDILGKNLMGISKYAINNKFYCTNWNLAAIIMNNMWYYLE